MITASQCRAARGLLNWTQEALATAANVGVVTVRQFEAERGSARGATMAVITQAFERAGVEFIADNGGGAGVRMKKKQRRQQPKLIANPDEVKGG